MGDHGGGNTYHQSSKISYVDQLLDKVMSRFKANQAMIVTAQSESGPQAILEAYEKGSEGWRKTYTMPAVIGKKGITFDMREGGMRSPAGMYRIAQCFGTEPKPVDVTLPYRQTTDHDFWIDDVDSVDYNRWVVYDGNPDECWQSYERLNIELYKYAAVIHYNEEAIPGKGSAIFFHIWPGRDKFTAGCTAVSEENILKLLTWMDPDKNPVIIQGTYEQLEQLMVSQ